MGKRRTPSKRTVAADVRRRRRSGDPLNPRWRFHQLAAWVRGVGGGEKDGGNNIAAAAASDGRRWTTNVRGKRMVVMMMMRRPVLLLLLLLPHGLFRPSARSRCPLPRCRSPVQSRHDRGGVVGEGGGSISRDGEERRCNDSGGGEVRKKKEWRKLWEGRRKEKQEERKEESRLSEKKPGKGVRSGREEGPCTKARERKEGGGEEAIELREGLL